MKTFKAKIMRIARDYAKFGDPPIKYGTVRVFPKGTSSYVPHSFLAIVCCFTRLFAMAYPTQGIFLTPREA